MALINEAIDTEGLFGDPWLIQVGGMMARVLRDYHTIHRVPLSAVSTKTSHGYSYCTTGFLYHRISLRERRPLIT